MCEEAFPLSASPPSIRFGDPSAAFIDYLWCGAARCFPKPNLYDIYRMGQVTMECRTVHEPMTPTIHDDTIDFSKVVRGAIP